MPDRKYARDRFLARHNWSPEHRSLLADDASFRSYDRLVDGQRRAVLMNAPPPQEETRPFIRVAELLRNCGLRAPEIYASDTELGFLLLEDFGDETYTQLLKTAPEQERHLYELAIDVLIHLHKRPQSDNAFKGMEPYSMEQYLQEVGLFTDWYLPRVLGHDLPPEATVLYQTLWRDYFEFALSQPLCLVLRDYHVDNLVLLDGNEGLASCGLLDFQDALIGSRTYDLMSLLEDARRDVSDNLVEHLKARYYSAFSELSSAGPARDRFEATYAILGAGRHAKVIGIFTRLCFRDAKPQYLVHILRVWKLLERSLHHPMLEPLADWFETYVPGPARIVPPDLVKEAK